MHEKKHETDGILNEPLPQYIREVRFILEEATSDLRLKLIK